MWFNPVEGRLHLPATAHQQQIGLNTSSLQPTSLPQWSTHHSKVDKVNPQTNLLVQILWTRELSSIRMQGLGVFGLELKVQQRPAVAGNQLQHRYHKPMKPSKLVLSFSVDSVYVPMCVHNVNHLTLVVLNHCSPLPASSSRARLNTGFD
jgi:hypothetical protein